MISDESRYIKSLKSLTSFQVNLCATPQLRNKKMEKDNELSAITNFSMLLKWLYWPEPACPAAEDPSEGFNPLCQSGESPFRTISSSSAGLLLLCPHYGGDEHCRPLQQPWEILHFLMFYIWLNSLTRNLGELFGPFNVYILICIVY